MIRFITLLAVLLSAGAAAQSNIQWQKCLGGTSYDDGGRLINTADGGYGVLMYAGSSNGNITDHIGSYDLFFVKMDAAGNIQWKKSFGGTGSELAAKVFQVADGGYLLVGSTESNNVNVSGNHGSGDIWLCRITATGAIVWQKCIGGTGLDSPGNAAQAADGGFFIAGISESTDGDIYCTTDVSVYSDIAIVKVDSLGNVVWSNCVGGSSQEYGWGIAAAPNNGCIVTGNTLSTDGVASGNHGGRDAFVIRVDSTGQVVWTKCFGGTQDDYFGSILPTDYGYLFSGGTLSNDGDVSGNHGDQDMWMVKIDDDGNLLEQRCLGGSDYDVGGAVHSMGNNHFAVGGTTQSSDGDVTADPIGLTDIWVIALDDSLNIQWQDRVGGSDYENTSDMVYNNGYFLVTASTTSNDNDISGNHGSYDVWVCQLYMNPYTGTGADTVRGRVYVDVNHNCVYDSSDYPLVHEIVSANGNAATTFTDSLGIYTLLTDTGTYAIAHTPLDNTSAACPPNASVSVSFPAAGMAQNNVDFADTLTATGCSDLSVYIGTWALRKCDVSTYTVYYCNSADHATVPLHLDIAMPDSVYMLSSSLTPNSVDGNVHTFSLPYMHAGECGWFYFMDSVDCGVPLGAVKCATAMISGTADCDSTNNTSVDCNAVVYSFDPNNMLVQSQQPNLNGFVFGETIAGDDSLVFHIDFQNTGTDTAKNIVVMDTLPGSLIPWTAITLGASHPFTVVNNGGILVWTFADINLPDSGTNELASHGFVSFRIQQESNNEPGSLIPNRASIYFDTNEPVVTNYATDTLASPDRIYETGTFGFDVFPNPATETVFVRYANPDQLELRVYNAFGQMQHEARFRSNAVLDVKKWPKGMYWIRLSNGNATVATRAVSVQ